MATINVNSASALVTAVRSASAGDTILLASGDYGDLDLSGRNFGSPVTIRSASGDGAVFSNLELNNMSGITISSVSITGSGSGTGFRVSSSDNITIENSTISGSRLGIQAWNADNLDILNNDLRDIGYDGIVIGHVHGLLIQGNDVVMNVNNSDGHSDVLQIYNQGSVAPASNIVVRNNTFQSDDGSTHGIFMGNNDAGGGNRSEFYRDIMIENNTIRTGQVLGLAVGQADGVVIRNNVVLQHDDVNSSRDSNIPAIRVQQASIDVTITGNTGHKQPAAAGGNFQPVDTPGGWNISGNNIVPVGSGGSAPPASGGSGGGSTGGGSAPPPADDLGNGQADTFRFDGDSVRGQDYNQLDLDFREGDRLILVDYDPNTFRYQSGGNPAGVSNNGEDVTMDSIADISEINQYSSRVSINTSGDDLVMHIQQNAGTHHITFDGLAELV